MTQTRELARQLNPVAGNTGGLSSALQELALHARPAPPVEHTLKQFPHRDMSVKFGWPQLLAWLVLSAGLALSIVAYFHFHVRTMDEDRATFEEESREAQRAVETRLETYASLMLGLRSLHLSAGGINDDSLQGYVGKLELPERFPAVQRLDYVRADQARNGPGMFIYPGRYGTERISGNDGLHPTDLEPGLLNEIRDSGDFVLSPVAGKGDIAMPLRLAVYRHNFPIVTVAERRQAFTGSIGMFVSLRQLVKEVVSAQTRGVVRIRIHALPQAGKAMSPTEKLERQLLLDSSGMAELTEVAAFSWAGSEAALHRISLYRLGNAVLEFEFSAAPGSFDSSMSQILPVFVLLAGLIISLLLFGLLNSLALSRRTLEFAVAERTRELEAISQALQQEEAERNQLEREISHLNVDERRRFSQDLHDNIAQRLTAIGFMLESLASEIGASDRPAVRRTDGGEGDGCSPANLSAALKPGLQDAHALALRTGVHIRTAIAHTRMLARGLSPVAVEAGGFISALTHLADSIRETFRIDCRLEHDGCSIPDNAVLQHNLYRITQQAINNALTHGKATRIVIELSENSGDGRGLRLAIMDNGAGFNADPGMNSGLGLEIMRYRCSMLGLGLEIQSVPSGGTAIVIEQRRSKE